MTVASVQLSRTAVIMAAWCSRHGSARLVITAPSRLRSRFRFGDRAGRLAFVLMGLRRGSIATILQRRRSVNQHSVRAVSPVLRHERGRQRVHEGRKDLRRER
jgi:hypothetical protein